MSKREKIINRLKSKPRDMTFAELEALLLSLGFKLKNKGRSSGSRVEFVLGGIEIELHRPHGRRALQPYQLRDVLRSLESGGII